MAKAHALNFTGQIYWVVIIHDRLKAGCAELVRLYALNPDEHRGSGYEVTISNIPNNK